MPKWETTLRLHSDKKHKDPKDEWVARGTRFVNAAQYSIGCLGESRTTETMQSNRIKVNDLIFRSWSWNDSIEMWFFFLCFQLSFVIARGLENEVEEVDVAATYDGDGENEIWCEIVL